MPVYYLQDANWDTTAVVGFIGTTGAWGVTQRYVYSPYGSITVLNADWSTPPAGTQPMVNNLYQGMTLDVVTGLYYSRNRDYSPTLGTWISQDPLSYVNGANTYQFVGSAPVGTTDLTGTQVYIGPGSGWGGNSAPPPNLAQDIAALQNELAYFRKSGYTMAAALLQGFLGNRNGSGFPGGATNAFNNAAFRNEIKGSKFYREKTKSYFQNYVKGFVRANRAAFPNGKTVVVPLPAKAQKYIQFYFDIGYGDSAVLANDLMYAFGGLVLNFTGSVSVTRCHDDVTWATKGLEVKTNDKYAFPIYGNFWKEFAAQMSNAFDAGYELENDFRYKPFTHSLNWPDSFSGEISPPPENWTWFLPEMV